jgi:cytochrome c biogenesis protein CcmG/thiol:disulfide interchange protein DsbE
MKVRFLWPLVAFGAMLVTFVLALGRDPKQLPSPLVGRPAPAFSAPVLQQPSTLLQSDALRGQVWVFNVWASWCGACRDEHDALMGLARQGVPLYGLNYKDTPGAAAAWLQQAGDPYRSSVVDAQGRIGMDYGVYGVPETFVIDRGGIVRYRHAGPVTPAVLQQELLPLLAELQR